MTSATSAWCALSISSWGKIFEGFSSLWLCAKRFSGHWIYSQKKSSQNQTARKLAAQRHGRFWDRVDWTPLSSPLSPSCLLSTGAFLFVQTFKIGFCLSPPRPCFIKIFFGFCAYLNFFFFLRLLVSRIIFLLFRFINFFNKDKIQKKIEKWKKLSMERELNGDTNNQRSAVLVWEPNSIIKYWQTS